MALREGKSMAQVALKNITIYELDQIAEKLITSRSKVISIIVEENIEKYYKKYVIDKNNKNNK